MSKNRKKFIEKSIARKRGEIDEVNKNFFGDVLGVSQAIGQLKKALEKVDTVISWAFSDKPNSELTVRALRLAVSMRQVNIQTAYN